MLSDMLNWGTRLFVGILAAPFRLNVHDLTNKSWENRLRNINGRAILQLDYPTHFRITDYWFPTAFYRKFTTLN